MIQKLSPSTFLSSGRSKILRKGIQHFKEANSKNFCQMSSLKKIKLNYYYELNKSHTVVHHFEVICFSNEISYYNK